MRIIKEYLCEGKHPTDDEIKESIEIANKEDCIVKIVWFFPYNGWHKLFIKKNASFEECKSNLPKRYPV